MIIGLTKWFVWHNVHLHITMNVVMEQAGGEMLISITEMLCFVLPANFNMFT